MSTVSAGVTISPAGRQAAFAARWRREHLFFTILPIVMATAVFVGFSRTYYLKSVYGTPELAWLYHVHGAAFTTWLLLLIVQPALVLARRTPLHRQVGWIAVVLVPVMTVLAWLVSVDLGRRGGGPPGVPSIQFLTVPMATIVVFPAFVAAALYWRGKPEIHKRLMLIATLELVPAGFGRVPGTAAVWSTRVLWRRRPVRAGHDGIRSRDTPARASCDRLGRSAADCHAGRPNRPLRHASLGCVCALGDSVRKLTN